MATTSIMIIAGLIIVVMIIAGPPVFTAFGGAIAWLVVALQLNPILLGQVGYSNITSSILLAIPLFIVGGALMSGSRMGASIVDWFSCFLGRIKGYLIPVAVCAFALFGAVSGSGMAVLSAIGPLLFAKMKEHNYPQGVAAAVLCCSAPLGLLIPPSTAQVLYAWAANVSVLACFLAIVVPGLLCTLLISLLGLYIARKKEPNLPCVVERVGAKIWLKNTGYTTWKSLPSLFMPVVILGGIYSGVMTPTESAAVAAVYAMAVACFLYREVKLKELHTIMTNAATSTGTILCITFFLMIFSRIALQENIAQIILDMLLRLSSNKYVLLLIINLFMVFLGMFINDTCGILIVATILTPVVTQLGVSPYQFAAIVGVNLGFGNITPPCAPFLYVTSRITGVPVNQMMKPTLLLLAFAYIPVLLLTTFIPAISLWLPGLVMGPTFPLY